jgi:hypothetical protein
MLRAMLIITAMRNELSLCFTNVDVLMEWRDNGYLPIGFHCLAIGVGVREEAPCTEENHTTSQSGSCERSAVRYSVGGIPT